MLQLDTKMVRISSVDIRKAKDDKGDEHTVCDIGISAPMENDVLDQFHPQLKAAFYAPDPQDDLVNGNRLPNLKFPFPRFSWKGTLEGYTFVGHVGAGGPSEINLNDAVINKVFFLLKDKGTVDMDYIARARTNPLDTGKLGELLGTEVQISLIPPDEKKQFELEQQKKNRKRALDNHFSGDGTAAQSNDTKTGNLLNDGNEDEIPDPKTQTSEIE